MHGEEPGELLLVKLIRSYMAYRIFWSEIHREATMTAGCKEFNTSLIERFNATMRERLASLARKCRHAAQRLETLKTGMASEEQRNQKPW